MFFPSNKLSKKDLVLVLTLKRSLSGRTLEFPEKANLNKIASKTSIIYFKKI